MSYDRDGEYGRGERSVALDLEMEPLRLLARSLAKALTGRGPWDKHTQALCVNLEDRLLAAVFEAYCPTREQWEQDVEEDEAWEGRAA